MATIITDQGAVEVATSDKGDGGLWLSNEAAEQATGWSMKPEGFCRSEVCVPVPAGRETEFRSDGMVNVAGFWRHMGRPAVHTETGDVWLLGASAGDRAAALDSLEAPDFTLPDLDGNLHSLSDHRGTKVLLATWASW